MTILGTGHELGVAFERMFAPWSALTEDGRVELLDARKTDVVAELKLAGDYNEMEKLAIANDLAKSITKIKCQRMRG